MAIDLPPVIPPQLSTAERIEAQSSISAGTIQTRVGETPVKISGNRYLTEEQILRLTGASKTPSQAIRALNQAYYRSGHLLVTVYYAQRGDTVYVHVVNGELAAIEGPDSVKSHFSPLVGDDDLTVDEFERRRVLAELQAQRMGREYVIKYKTDDDPSKLSLVFTHEEASDYSPTEFSLSMGNEGNRFVGRYFGGAEIRHHFWNGTELKLEYDGALTDWGENSGGKNYHGLSLKLGKPTRLGLYGMEVSAVDYERDAFLVNSSQPDNSPVCLLLPVLCPTPAASRTAVVVEGEIQSAALTGEQILFANRQHRLTVSERLEYTESEVSLDNGQVLEDEAHGGLEVGLKYFRQSRVFGQPVRWSAQGFVESGLSGDSGTLGTEDFADAVSSGKRTAEYLLFKPKLGMKIGLGGSFSFDIDVLGQYADGKQVPQQKQFVLGGISTLAAYLPGALIGDSGYYVRTKLAQDSWTVFGMELTPSIFIEHGEAVYEDAGGEFGRTRSLTDAGFRVEGELGRGFTTQFVTAFPISERNVNEDVAKEMEADFFWQLRKVF